MNFFQFFQFLERYIPYPEYALPLLIAAAALLIWRMAQAYTEYQACKKLQ